MLSQIPRPGPARVALIGLSVGVAAYFLWCAVTDTPSHWLGYALLALVLLGGAILMLWERRSQS